MAIEQYARTTALFVDDVNRQMECTPGLEYRDEDDIELLTSEIGDAALEALCDGQPDHKHVSGFVVGWILSNYPDRAYFVETEINGRGVQVYDPKNFVKERCPCGTTCQRT